MPVESIFFFASAAAVFALAQLWYWWLRLHEERTIWLGAASIAGIASIDCGLVLLMLALFPEDAPWVRAAIDILVVVPVLCLLALPLALVCVLIASGIRLMRREGVSLRNMLSLSLGIAIVAYVAFWPAIGSSLQRIPVAGPVFGLLCGVFASLIGIFSVSFILYTVAGIAVQIPHRGRRYDAIVVLGAGLMPDGRVTPLLGNRVKRGIELLDRHPESVLLMSGGQGPDEACPESHAMRAFAEQLGVPADRILVEDRSANTEENIAFSEAVREEAGRVREGRILVVTDDYHVLRALMLARADGIAADGAGSKVKRYFALNALVREWVAYIYLKRAAYTKIAVVVLACYIVAALLRML